MRSAACLGLSARLRSLRDWRTGAHPVDCPRGPTDTLTKIGAPPLLERVTKIADEAKARRRVEEVVATETTAPDDLSPPMLIRTSQKSHPGGNRTGGDCIDGASENPRDVALGRTSGGHPAQPLVFIQRPIWVTPLVHEPPARNHPTALPAALAVAPGRSASRDAKAPR